LPAPDGPTSATVCPGSIVTDRSASTVRPGRDGYTKRTASNSMRAPARAGGSARGCGGSAIAERSSSSSIRRSVAPAARSRSPQTSASTATLEATSVM
jgi:hypothetical protein